MTKLSQKLFMLSFTLRSDYEFVVNCLYRFFKVCVIHADDDVQLAGALIDHADVDILFGKRHKDGGSRTFGIFHAAAHDGDKGDILFDADAVGCGGGHKVGNDDILATLQFMLVDDDAHGIDAAGQMFEVHAVLLKNLQELAAETDLFVHHVLFER